jgi:hypothetical protein
VLWRNLLLQVSGIWAYSCTLGHARSCRICATWGI